MLLLFYFYHLLIIPRTPMIPTVVLKLLHEIANNDFRCNNREALIHFDCHFLWLGITT